MQNNEIVKRLRKIIDGVEYDTPVEEIILSMEALIIDIDTPVIDWGPTVCNGEALARIETDKERETRIKRQRLGFL